MARFVLELDDGSASVMRNLQPHELSYGALAKCLETPAGALHDDVIKWKYFPRYWPFVWVIPRWITHTKASDVELWCLLWSAPE